MRRSTLLHFCSLIICHFVQCGATPKGAEAEDMIPQIIGYSSIPKQVKIIGRLGVPLGEEVVVIRGKWKYTTLDNDDSEVFGFVIESVNNATIKSPIRFACTDFAPVTPKG